MHSSGKISLSSLTAKSLAALVIPMMTFLCFITKVQISYIASEQHVTIYDRPYIHV